MIDDDEAIKQLKARYFRLMDTKDGLAGVFSDDVTIDITGEGGGVMRSVEEYMPFLREVFDAVITVHPWAHAGDRGDVADDGDGHLGAR